VLESMESGLPLLREACAGDPADLRALAEQYRTALTLIPKEADA
jgi:hypothetical protein